MAKNCLEVYDTCGSCAERHRTDECENHSKLRCVSCKSDTHASWSRECPTFLRKAEDYNERNPDNLFPFYHTSDSWTWTGSDTNLKHKQPKVGSQAKSGLEATQQGAKGKGKEPARMTDTYIPNYSGGWPAELDEELENMGDDGWGEVAPPRASAGPARPPQQSKAIKFVNNAQRAGPSSVNPGQGPNQQHTSNINPSINPPNA